MFVRFAQIIAIVLVVFASFIAMAGAFSSKIPVYEFETDCDFWTGYNMSEEEANERREALGLKVQEFVAFAHEHAAEVVYLRFKVEASDHSGACAIGEEQADELNAAREEIGRPLGVRIGRQESGSRAGQLNLSVWTPQINAGNSVIYLPEPSELDLRGLYTNSEDGYYYAVTGPFVLQYHQGNGFDGVSFLPVQRSEQLWREVTCAKRSLQLPPMARSFLPCF